MEYKATTETDATKPVETVSTASPIFHQPSPVDELKNRLAVLTGAGVQEYQDGQLHILFKRERRAVQEQEDPVSRALREYDEQLLGGDGG